MPRGSFALRKYVKCSTHGRVPWEGHLICDGCGSVFSTQDDSLPTHVASDDCPTCGKLLVPPATRELGAPAVEFTARIICPACFAARTAAADADGGSS